MNSSPPMHVLQTRREHLGFFHSLMFCLKLIRELLFFIFAGSCCHNCGLLYAIVSSPQYTVFGNWLSRFLGFRLVYGIFFSLNISFIKGEDTPFRNLKLLIISCWIYEYIYKCLLSLAFLKVHNSSRCNHYDINVKACHVVCWFFCETW